MSYKVDIQIDLFLEGVYRIYGYDFRSYSKASVKRRIDSIMQDLNLNNYAELQHNIFHDEHFFRHFLLKMSITVTEMFRDPNFFLNLKKYVIPQLESYPYFKVWHAGCATGEEVYSMAILLHEAGLLDRATIYATDFNNHALEKAKSGIYSLDTLEKYIVNYNTVSDQNRFSDYYCSKYGAAKIRDFLKKRITFASHNLVTDNSFGEMNIIFCRNVLIYFNSHLQNRVLDLFYNSLSRFGYLCLGARESLESHELSKKFNKICKNEKIYRRT